MAHFQKGTALPCVRTLAIAASVLAPVLATAQPAPVAFPRVTPAEQASRDADRLAILQEELASETRRHGEAGRRRAERLAAGDRLSAEEAEAALRRSSANIAALQREIEGARRVPPGNALTAVPAAPRRDPSPSSVTVPSAPWWDVYSRPPRRDDIRGPAEQGARVGAAHQLP